ncbi:cav-1 [Pristionchus pacificus]|uniref:Caveolin n=1 Tax=Pristionchus pacificus TaxID=54126 RepID=A0A2A6C4I8_PRIPA|nr:cav-1 [Pristionchus pacificus]|eukprot:PDM72941.1 cav-1 [Pristionchus pacificus]
MSTEEKVEMEAVPLKTDTDEAKTETTETVIDKKEAPKKTWFFKSDKKKVVTEEDVEEGKEKTKKKCFWRCQKEKKETGDEEEQKQEMTIGIDMQMRDEKQINNHVNIQFDDVFAEPETFHSVDCIWRINHRIFESTRTFFYKVFGILSIPIVFIFAILFAFASAVNNFLVMPLAALFTIPLTWIAKTWTFLVSNIFDPVANSIGLCFSKINVRKYGINNAPTDLIQA